MPNFHETMMGRRFFESQLPTLIKSIDRLSNAVENNNSDNNNEDIIIPLGDMGCLHVRDRKNPDYPGVDIDFEYPNSTDLIPVASIEKDDAKVKIIEYSDKESDEPTNIVTTNL